MIFAMFVKIEKISGKSIINVLLRILVDVILHAIHWTDLLKIIFICF